MNINLRFYMKLIQLKLTATMYFSEKHRNINEYTKEQFTVISAEHSCMMREILD